MLWVFGAGWPTHFVKKRPQILRQDIFRFSLLLHLVWMQYWWIKIYINRCKNMIIKYRLRYWLGRNTRLKINHSKVLLLDTSQYHWPNDRRSLTFLLLMFGTTKKELILLAWSATPEFTLLSVDHFHKGSSQIQWSFNWHLCSLLMPNI